MAVLQSGIRLSGMLQRLNHRICPVSTGFFRKPILNLSPLCIIRQSHPEVQTTPIFSWHVLRFYRASFRRTKSNKKMNTESQKESSQNIDDLKSLLQDKSMSLTAKFKVLFQQYGAVLVIVHLFTAAFWMGIFYFAVSRGVDIVPFLEEHGVFNFLERIGLPVSDKVKSPGASNLLAAYLLYEVAKPIRYPVTIIGTIYAVRFLRRFKYLKGPPKTDATVRDLVQTQGKIVGHHIRHTTSKYQEHYRSRLRRNLRKNGHSKLRSDRKH